MRDYAKMRLTCKHYEDIKLVQNEHKGCWLDQDLEELISLVIEEYEELIADLKEKKYKLAIMECADLRNATGFLLEKLYMEQL